MNFYTGTATISQFTELLTASTSESGNIFLTPNESYYIFTAALSQLQVNVNLLYFHVLAFTGHFIGIGYF